MMESFIRPDIFNGRVQAFFTGRTIGADIKSLCRILSVKEEGIFLPEQKHTDIVHVIGSDRSPVIADAVVTGKKGIIIGVRVADCVPVLVFDNKKAVAGAAHAGWRGTAAQIVKKTIRAMSVCFKSRPEDIFAALGPSIGRCCYHVGEEVIDAVYEGTGEGDYYSREDDGRYFLDLSSANRVQMMSVGVPAKNIWISDECTCCIPDKYYSFRFSKGHNGSQGGFIGIL